MSLRRAALLALSLCLVAPPALGQGVEELLTPLVSPPARPKGKATRRPSPPRSKGSKQALDDADLLAPLVGQAELLVQLSGGIRGARLFLDGQEVGVLPRGPLAVSPGEHTLVVRRDGYRDFHRRLVAVVGELTEVRVQLEAVATVPPRAPVLTPSASGASSPLAPLPPAVASADTPLLQRWYFWAGVGAVAAAVVGTVVATQSPGRPLSPTEVCNGPCDAVINGPVGAGLLRF